MENAEEVLQCLDEFTKMKPKDIPRELEDYLCFVAKTGDPVYQWSMIKCLFREKLLNVITDFYETCPSVDVPPCPNVDTFDYDSMKNFILEKLESFAAAPFTVQRICELLTAPRKEYNRIDKYMRALEKNILVVSTREPGNRRNAENGETVESIVNGLESEHVSQDINVEVEMDESAPWQKTDTAVSYPINEPVLMLDTQAPMVTEQTQENFDEKPKEEEVVCQPVVCPTNIETVITCRPVEDSSYTTALPASDPDETLPEPSETDTETSEPIVESEKSETAVSSTEKTDMEDKVEPSHLEPDVEIKEVEAAEAETAEAEQNETNDVESEIVEPDIADTVTSTEPESTVTEEPERDQEVIDSSSTSETPKEEEPTEKNEPTESNTSEAEPEIPTVTEPVENVEESQSVDANNDVPPAADSSEELEVVAAKSEQPMEVDEALPDAPAEPKPDLD